MARQQKSPACTACEAGTNNATPLKRGVHADGQNFECNAKTWLLRERSGARTREFPWREWQVDTNQTSRTEYNPE